MFKKLNEKFSKKINLALLISAFSLFTFIFIWVSFFKGIPILDKTIISEKIETMTNLNIYDRFKFQFSLYDTLDFQYFMFVIVEILLFVPLGVLLPLVVKNKSFYFNLAIALLFSLVAESAQLITGLGYFEILDVIYNLMGFIGGSAIVLLLDKYKHYNQFINYSNLIFIVILVPLIIFAFASIFSNLEVFAPSFSALNFENLVNAESQI